MNAAAACARADEFVVLREQKTQRLSAADQAGAAGRDSPPSDTRGPAALAIQPASEDSEYLWRADASITARVYNTNRQSAVRAASAELWDSTGLRDKFSYGSAALFRPQDIQGARTIAHVTFRRFCWALYQFFDRRLGDRRQRARQGI
jgi:hypothetical protein